MASSRQYLSRTHSLRLSQYVPHGKHFLGAFIDPFCGCTSLLLKGLLLPVLNVLTRLQFLGYAGGR